MPRGAWPAASSAHGPATPKVRCPRRSHSSRRLPDTHSQGPLSCRAGPRRLRRADVEPAGLLELNGPKGLPLFRWDHRRRELFPSPRRRRYRMPATLPILAGVGWTRVFTVRGATAPLNPRSTRIHGSAALVAGPVRASGGMGGTDPCGARPYPAIGEINGRASDSQSSHRARALASSAAGSSAEKCARPNVLWR